MGVPGGFVRFFMYLEDYIDGGGIILIHSKIVPLPLGDKVCLLCQEQLVFQRDEQWWGTGCCLVL